MIERIESHVAQVLRQIDGSKKDKEDLFEELTLHLHMASEDWMKSGLSEKEAVEKAIDEFGNSEKVGSEIQEAMYPYRKWFLLILAIVSIFYTYLTYLLELFINGDAHYIWLLLSITNSAALLVLAFQMFPEMDRKIVVNSSLIIHAFIYLLGTGFTTSWSMLAWGIVLATIGLVYRTTIVDYDFNTVKYRKHLKIFHLYNITIGLIFIGTSLFFLWAFLAFSDEFTVGMLLFLVPLVIWLLVYYLQISFVYRGHVLVAIFIGMLPLGIVAIVGGLFIYEVFSNGVTA